jgi:hypothetical protein
MMASHAAPHGELMRMSHTAEQDLCVTELANRHAFLCSKMQQWVTFHDSPVRSPDQTQWEASTATVPKQLRTATTQLTSGSQKDF